MGQAISKESMKMKTPFFFCVVAAGATVWPVSYTRAQQKSPSTEVTSTVPEGTSQSKAEGAIRQAAREFTEAFDRGDAVALARHFTTDAVYIDENGQRFEGQKSIQREYEILFANHSKLHLQLEVDSIRLVNATTAIEEGRLAMTPQPPGAIRVMSRYTAIHIRQDGKWRMVDVRDTRVEMLPDYGQLEDLDWLVGTWNTANQDTQIEVKTRWIENHHFLTRSHSVTESGKTTSTGLQIIGLDPSTGQITCWSFTSDGGHAIGVWAPHARGWIIQTLGTMNDGTTTSAINMLSREDKNTLVWKSAERFVGDTPLPDTQEVTLKRN
jgi:uncharacterized protein (TIGR02246 family)